MRTRRIRWPLLAILAATALSLALVGCGGNSFNVDKETVVRSILEEDSAIHATCIQLHSESVNHPGPGAAEAMLWDIELGLARFLRSFRIEQGIKSKDRVCVPNEIVQRVVVRGEAFPAACQRTIETSLAEIAADRSKKAEKLRQLLGSYQKVLESAHACEKECNVAAVLARRTALVVRLIDLSPAVVTRLVYLGNSIDDVAEQTAESIPVVPSGISRLALRALAAEIVASVADQILHELEESRLISEASVARSACQLYNSGQPFPDVTATILKRAILRFSHGSGRTYPALVFCHQNPGRCKQARELVGVSSVGLTPRLRRRQQPRRTQQVHDDVQLQADRILDATSVCAGRSNCPIPVINRVASILVVAGDVGQELEADQAREYLKRMESMLGEASGRIREMHETLPGVDQRLSEVERSVARLAGLSAAEVSANGYLRVKIIELLAELRKCRKEIATARSAREALLERLTGKRLSCGESWESVVVPLPDGRTTSTLERKQVCTLGIPLQLDLTADTLFKRCYGDTLDDPSSLLPRLARWLDEVGPSRVIVEAHTDARPPSLRPREDGRPCRGAYATNQHLSEARAKTAAGELSRRLTDASIEVMAYGRSDFEAKRAETRKPMRERCHDDDDECHSQYRRITIRVWGGEADVDLSCMD